MSESESWDDGTAWFQSFVDRKNTPNYHSIVTQGLWLPENDYLRYETRGLNPTANTYLGDVRQPPFTPGLRFALVSGSHSHKYGNIPIRGLVWHHAAAETRLAAKVNGSLFDAGVALAEYRSTSRFIAGTMVRVADAYRRFRRRDYDGMWRRLTGLDNGGWRDVPGALSNAWLGYTYGLKPLLQDVHGAAEALAHAYGPDQQVFAVRTRVEEPLVSNYENNGSFRYSSIIDARLTVSGKCAYRVTDPWLATLSSVGLTNPASVLWEVVPFSFVVDWFLPIGDWLMGIKTPEGVEFLGGYTSVRGEGSLRMRNIREDAPSPGFNVRATTLEWLYERKALDAFPTPVLQLPDLSLTWQQITSGMALLVQQVRRFG